MTTVTTAEKLIKKDFALDPEESKMRLAAHYMVRHIAAAMVRLVRGAPSAKNLAKYSN